jgi:hypothetical protein
MIVSPLTSLLKTVRFFSFEIPEKSESNEKTNRTYDFDEQETNEIITDILLKKIG